MMSVGWASVAWWANALRKEINLCIGSAFSLKSICCDTAIATLTFAPRGMTELSSTTCQKKAKASLRGEQYLSMI